MHFDQAAFDNIIFHNSTVFTLNIRNLEMKCQNLFSEKNKKNISEGYVV